MAMVENIRLGLTWFWQDAKLPYPTDLDSKIASTEGVLNIEFPRTRMACLVKA
jgi:hypothetical protein